MDWQTFSGLVNYGHYSDMAAPPGRISQVLGALATFQQVPFGPNAWYPMGIQNHQPLNGYRLTDQDHSCCTTSPVLVAEASSCVILILVDPQGPTHFAAHIGADSILKGPFWQIMHVNLTAFFSAVGHNIGRPNMFLFSQNMHRGQAGGFELQSVMTLLSNVLPDSSLQQLATSTYMIEGEGGNAWNSYCSVRVDYVNAVHLLHVMFSA